MAKEADQTRWVGVRPTDPSEDIPTTTKKILPAISDLQAVKEIYHRSVTEVNKDCSVSYISASPGVAAGELWVITNVMGLNADSLCDISIIVMWTGLELVLKTHYSVEPGIWSNWDGMIFLQEGERIGVRFRLGGVTDDLTIQSSGYKIGLY